MFFVGGVLTDVNKSNQVLVVEVFHDTEFVLKDCEVGCLFFVLLDGHVISILVLAELNLSMVTSTERFDDFVLVEV